MENAWAMCYVVDQMKDENVNVRMDAGFKARVDKAAEQVGVNPSALMRLLLARFIDHCERHGGRIVMPPEFKDFDIREKNGVYDQKRKG